jgi:transcriptional regulator with XRE-family HTH domain
MALGQKIKVLRKTLGWTLEDLSTRSGVDVGTISALEVRDSTRSKYAVKLAAALGTSLEAIENDEIDGARQITLTERQRALIGLFDGLTQGQQEDFIRSLESQKHGNDRIILELSKKRTA